MKQVARNLIDPDDGFLNGTRYQRNHQGLNNELIAKSNDEPNMDAAVECQERLGGVLRYYYRRAA